MSLELEFLSKISLTKYPPLSLSLSAVGLPGSTRASIIFSGNIDNDNYQAKVEQAESYLGLHRITCMLSF
jgi:hypothetical protein